MRTITSLALAAVAGIALTAAAVPAAQGQVQLSVNIGRAPACPYGYYDYSPYRCSPRGYYGPQYFDGRGMFIGVGPWFHGPAEFHGTVNNRYDPHYGYRGALPRVGQRVVVQPRTYTFRGNEERDGREHANNGHGNNGHGNDGHDNGRGNGNDRH